MEPLFTESEPIIDLFISRDVAFLTYNLGEKLILRNFGGEAKTLGEGAHLRPAGKDRFTFCKDGGLYLCDVKGATTRVTGKGNLVKKLANVWVKDPNANSAGDKIACVMAGVTRPDVWGEREYCGVVDLSKSTFEIFDLETYGGEAYFCPVDDCLTLQAWEVKSGIIYFLDLSGEMRGQFVGHSLAYSPAGNQVAFRKENMINVAAFDGKAWELTGYSSQPEDGMGPNHNAPVWIDDQTVLYDSQDQIYRFDLAKSNAKKVADLPGLSIRRNSTMVGPYKSSALAVINNNGQHEVVQVLP